jgi:hypothetical protein
MEEVLTKISASIIEGDVIATIGAGDVSIVGEKIQRRLEGKGVHLDAMAVKA